MIVVDEALRRRAEAGNPIRLGMVGAVFMARGLALQITQSIPGIVLAGIANRSIEGAERVCLEAEVENVELPQGRLCDRLRRAQKEYFS